MNKLEMTVSTVLAVGMTISATSAQSDVDKEFSFGNSYKYSSNPLNMYVESSQCIADPDSAFSQLGTVETPRTLGRKEVATALVRPESGLREGCSAEGAARFTVRFFEDSSANKQGDDVHPNQQHIASVTFSLGKNNIVNIDNQGLGGLLINDVSPKNKRTTNPSYLLDWQGLQAFRRDIVYNTDRRPEAVLKCINKSLKACTGTLHITSSSINIDQHNTSTPLIIAKGIYNIKYNSTKVVPLQLTRAGKELLAASATTGSGHDVILGAKPSGQSRAMTLTTANMTAQNAAQENTQYTLDVTNNSFSSTNFCIFQTTQDSSIKPVTWNSMLLYPGMSRSFSWTNNDYSFTWATGNVPQPGQTYNPAQSVNASLGQQIVFDANRRQFTDITDGPQQNSLYINSQGNYQTGQYTVGIGLSGYPLYVTAPQPGSTIQFTPTPNKIYLTTDPNCRIGSPVVDSAMKSAALLIYSGATKMTAIFNGPGWTIFPSW